MSVQSRALQLLQTSVIAFTVFVGQSCHKEAAKQEQSYTGTWVMTLGQRVFIVLTIEPRGQAFTARLQAPSSFDLPADGSRLRYSHIQLPIKDRRSVRAAIEGDHMRIVIEDPANPGEPDEFDLRLTEPERASLQYVDVPVAPFPLARHGGRPPAPATDWDANRAYTVDAEVTTANVEMASIYDADQKDRQNLLASSTDWGAVEKADIVRRTSVAALLAAGALHTADDYRKAAFVFQHGERPDDYLLAHTLALVAVTKGDQGAAWIAAATLDRYLQSVGQPQVYGTQFVGAGATMTQKPYNAQLISDALREELGVTASVVTGGATEDVAVGVSRQVESHCSWRGAWPARLSPAAPRHRGRARQLRCCWTLLVHLSRTVHADASRPESTTALPPDDDR